MKTIYDDFDLVDWSPDTHGDILIDRKLLLLDAIHELATMEGKPRDWNRTFQIIMIRLLLSLYCSL